MHKKESESMLISIKVERGVNKMAFTKMVCLLFTAVQFVRGTYEYQNPISTENASHCPTWQQRDSAGECVCGPNIEDTVMCKTHPYGLKVLSCYCITRSKSNNTVIGACPYTCWRSEDGYVYYFPVEKGNIDEFMCARYRRQGQMCGQCKPGHAPPAYSYSLSCVDCTTSNWGKYTAVSLLPLTAFFAFVVTFRISATSPMLQGFILCTQILLCPNNIRDMKHQTLFTQVVVTGLAVWNLDFFRLVYTPFCLHPNTNTLQVMALDYLIAVYPLLLIGLSYLLVLLYDHNARPVVFLCKPFVPLFIRFRRQWNIRNSLVDAFATFLLLSYVKVISVSVELLLPVVLYDQNGDQMQQIFVYNQGDVAYFSRHHLPYACLALFFLLTFTLLPMSLLFLYPCSCFQVCLNRMGLSCHSLHIFMDSFQGHFRIQPRDCRYFSALYLLLRILVYMFIALTYEIVSFAYTTAIIATLGLTVALIQPYKKCIHSIVDAVLLTTTALLYTTLAPLTFLKPVKLQVGLATINTVLLAIIIFYLPTVGCLLSCRFIYKKMQKHNCKFPCMENINRRGYERLRSTSS